MHMHMHIVMHIHAHAHAHARFEIVWVCGGHSDFFLASFSTLSCFPGSDRRAALRAIIWILAICIRVVGPIFSSFFFFVFLGTIEADVCHELGVCGGGWGHQQRCNYFLM